MGNDIRSLEKAITNVVEDLQGYNEIEREIIVSVATNRCK